MEDCLIKIKKIMLEITLIAVMLMSSTIAIYMVRKSRADGIESEKRFTREVIIISDPGDEVEHIYYRKK
jgi:hypothetical protein